MGIGVLPYGPLICSQSHRASFPLVFQVVADLLGAIAGIEVGDHLPAGGKKITQFSPGIIHQLEGPGTGQVKTEQLGLSAVMGKALAAASSSRRWQVRFIQVRR
jgi:hypothetical protein